MFTNSIQMITGFHRFSGWHFILSVSWVSCCYKRLMWLLYIGSSAIRQLSRDAVDGYSQDGQHIGLHRGSTGRVSVS